MPMYSKISNGSGQRTFSHEICMHQEKSTYLTVSRVTWKIIDYTQRLIDKFKMIIEIRRFSFFLHAYLYNIWVPDVQDLNIFFLVF